MAKKPKAIMGRPTKYKKEYCEKLLELGHKGKSVAAFCAEIGIGRDTYYRWAKEHEEFQDTIKKYKQISERYWEDMLQDYMVTGAGEKFNTTGWIFVMKNRFGWRDSQPDEKDKTAEITIKIDGTDQKL